MYTMLRNTYKGVTLIEAEVKRNTFVLYDTCCCVNQCKNQCDLGTYCVFKYANVSFFVLLYLYYRVNSHLIWHVGVN